MSQNKKDKEILYAKIMMPNYILSAIPYIHKFINLFNRE